MWDTLALPWRICLEEAWAAYRAGALPIGAAITDATGTIIARGRNRVFSDTDPDQRPHGHPLAHAEMHAFDRLDWDAVEPRECILYTTTEPCPQCFGAFYVSGLHELRYASRDPYGGSTDLLKATPYMRRKPVRLHGPERPDLEALIVALHIEFTLHAKGPHRAEATLALWSAAIPAGVALGRSLYTSGCLRRLRADAVGAEHAVEVLAKMLTDEVAGNLT